MSTHVESKRTYFSICGALLLLLAATIGVAYLDLGPWSPVLAITIAVAKALLVALFFMHLRHSSHLTWLFATVGVLWLLILFLLTLADVLTRDWLV